MMHVFGVIVFLIWFLYVMIDGKKFGSQPSCNHLVNFVLFFSDVRATATWFKVMMIVFFVGAIIPFFVLVLGFLILAPDRWTQRCADALDNIYKRNPWLLVVRYVIGIP
jgi:hypothetical protein